MIRELHSLFSAAAGCLLVFGSVALGQTANPAAPAEKAMNETWGDATPVRIDTSDRAALFRDGNYGMFIHWGLYSHLANRWKDETFYGIGEWMLRQQKIPVVEYQAVARDFNPAAFDAREIVRTAKAAGMRYIIITSKHHDGFAMFKSAHPFNIVDATPFGRDPMGELATACREAGLGFGFYYSHYQDWTAPGADGGPRTHADGSPAIFEQYFRTKCLPQVKEICTQYGPLNFVWFDTPNDMPKELVLELAEYVRKAQPGALLCSRIGYGYGDYATQGDMEVPLRNIEGLWETADTTNDSWGYAWYDQNWKDTREILHRLVATVGRGGTYLLNVGPDGRGRIPAGAANYLRRAGEWLSRHPTVVTAAGPSPWGHAMPWGDVTTQGNTLQLVIFDWPADGRLLLPGLKTDIVSAALETREGAVPVPWKRAGAWTTLQLPPAPVDRPASVVKISLQSRAEVDATAGVLPNLPVALPVEFAEVSGATKRRIGWMEKFGEWKHATQVSKWTEEGRAVWTVDVAEAGDYRVDFVYRGEGRLVWRMETDDGAFVQNQQAATPVYHRYTLGLLTLAKPGRHTLTAKLVAGKRMSASLETVILSPAK